MIVEGCDILLDVNQMFVRQGTLVQTIHRKEAGSAAAVSGGRSRRAGLVGAMGGGKDREAVRQCFLFSNHLIITTRTQAGRLHLVDDIGKVALADVTLIEDPNEADERPGSPTGRQPDQSPPRWRREPRPSAPRPSAPRPAILGDARGL